jgi:hypothetical protein
MRWTARDVIRSRPERARFSRTTFQARPGFRPQLRECRLVLHEKPMEDFDDIVVYHINRKVALEKCSDLRSSGARLRNCRRRRVERTGAPLAR